MSWSLKGDLLVARRFLLKAAESEECKWCRSHVLKVADSVSSLIYLASVSEELKTHPGVLRAMRTIGQTTEELRMVEFLTKISNSRIARFVFNVG